MNSNTLAPVSKVSVVVPMYNEIENVPVLINRVCQELKHFAMPWELILVDDGSTDGTTDALHMEAAKHTGYVRIVELTRNYKQTAAMQAGIDAARGDVIVTMDGDLQNDPSDIPAMVERLLKEDLDLVSGWRKNRKDPMILRKIPSKIANRIIGWVTGIDLMDYGCSLKVFRASTLRRVRLYGEMHRFIPAWLATVTSKERIAQHVVKHNARQFGESKYGISRTFRVILDLFFVYFLLRFRARPGHFFGGIGLFLGSAGGLVLSYLAAIKLAFGQDIGTRPLLFLGFFLVIAGVQMLTTGVLAEVLVRVMFESGTAQSYSRHSLKPVEDEEGWHHNR